MRWSPTAWRRAVSSLALLGAIVLSTLLLSSRSSAQAAAQTVPSLPAVTRQEALQRAQQWVDNHVNYSQQQYWQGYRKDCVGLVSMAWGVPPVGMGNTVLARNYVTVIAKDQLQPGDALLNADGGEQFGHIVLFAGWATADKKNYNGYEEDPYWGGAHLTLAIPYPYWPNTDEKDYQPVRYKGMLGASQDPSQPAFYAGKIVQWNGDSKQQHTSWLVSADLKRYWIPDIQTYYCLRGQGHADAGPISAQLLDQLPDQTGHWATCDSGPTAIATAPVAIILTPTPTVMIPTPPPVPAPPTVTPPPIYQEGAGPNGSPTFTDYRNAGGTQGPRIAAYGAVEVSCRVQGWKSPTAPPGDNWWYRVKSSPWSDAFYAYADNFYNVWPPTGPIINGVLVDTNVPLC